MSRPDIVYLRHILDEAIYLTSAERRTGPRCVSRRPDASPSVRSQHRNHGRSDEKLSGELRDRYPDVAWRAMAGMRDQLIHGYIGVDYEVVWNVAANKAPAAPRPARSDHRRGRSPLMLTRRAAFSLAVPVALVLLGYVLWPALRTFVLGVEHLPEFFGGWRGANVRALINSVGISLATVAGASVVGTGLAWGLWRYGLPIRRRVAGGGGAPARAPAARRRARVPVPLRRDGHPPARAPGGCSDSTRCRSPSAG